jgi:hypothetical protein
MFVINKHILNNKHFKDADVIFQVNVILLETGAGVVILKFNYLHFHYLIAMFYACVVYFIVVHMHVNTL